VNNSRTQDLTETFTSIIKMMLASIRAQGLRSLIHLPMLCLLAFELRRFAREFAAIMATIEAHILNAPSPSRRHCPTRQTSKPSAHLHPKRHPRLPGLVRQSAIGKDRPNARPCRPRSAPIPRQLRRMLVGPQSARPPARRTHLPRSDSPPASSRPAEVRDRATPERGVKLRPIRCLYVTKMATT
jgi:hypothetical protein